MNLKKENNMDEKMSKRCSQLFKMGLRFNGDSYVGFQENNRDFNFHSTEMLCDSDEQWDKKIKSVKEEMTRRGIKFEE